MSYIATHKLACLARLSRHLRLWSLWFVVTTRTTASSIAIYNRLWW